MKLHLKNMYYKHIVKPNNKIIDDTYFVGNNNLDNYFQIIIDSDSKNTIINLEKQTYHSLFNETSLRLEVICDMNYDLKPVGYVEANNYVKYSEIIYNTSQFSYKGDTFPLLICDLDTIDLKTNDYLIKVNLYQRINLSEEKLVDSKEITFKYINTSSYKNNLYVDFWQHTHNLARTFKVKTFSDRHFELIEKVFDKLKELNQQSIMLTVSDMPWRGWGCNLMRENLANLFEYNFIKTTKDLTGNYIYDYSNLDRYINLGISKEIASDISLYGLIGIWKMPFFAAPKVEYPEDIVISYYDETTNTLKFLESKLDITNYIKSLFNHLKELGVYDKVVIAADEPSDSSRFIQTINFLKEIDPNIKFKIAIDKPNILNDLGNNCDTLAYSFPCTLDNYKTAPENINKLYYVCNIPDHPNTQIENTLTETTLVPILNYTFKFKGFLRWAFTCFTIDPLNNIKYNVNNIPAGDLFFVYPNTNGDLLESVRYRGLKRGMIILELFNQLKLKDKNKADELYQKLVSSNLELKINDELTASIDPNVYETVLYNLVKALEV